VNVVNRKLYLLRFFLVDHISGEYRLVTTYFKFFCYHIVVINYDPFTCRLEGLHLHASDAIDFFLASNHLHF
jgi:hypothetical protein